MPQPKTTAKPGLDLDALTDAELEQLRARLSERDRVAAAGNATARDRALFKLLDPRDHMRNCPAAEGDAQLRVEAYPETRPAVPDKGIAATPVTVVRCITCGGVVVVPESYGDVIARIERATAQTT